MLESTAENSESSLNQSCRYSTKKLKEIKKSPLVLSKPPKIRDGLLDSSMNKAVWNSLFDRIEENSNEDKEREFAELLKNFRSLLNKITEENFDHLVKEINDKGKYKVNSSEKLSAVSYDFYVFNSHKNSYA